jgi:nucleoside phosphorylase
VLVSSSLIPYDNRDVKPLNSAPGYQSDYSALKLEPAREVLVARCQRERERSKYSFGIEVGALLSGAARIHCAAFRDELYRNVPHGNEPIIGGEMEGVGLLAGASRPGDPVWCVVKGISDFADENRDDDIGKSLPQAAHNAAKFVLSGLIEDAKVID